MKTLLILSLLLFQATPAQPQADRPAPSKVALVGDHVVIDGPLSVPVGGLCMITVKGLTAQDSWSWAVVPELQVVDLLNRQGEPVLFAPTSKDKTGRYHFVLAYIDDGKVVQKTHSVVVGDDDDPDVDPPVPPDPDVDPPVPPDVDPPLPPQPKGFRVLILEETEDRPRLPRGQLAALMSNEARAYMNQRTAKGPDGKTPEWRVFDDDQVDPTFLAENWRKAVELAKKDSAGKLPWVIVSDGTQGTSQPLPATEAEFVALLRKYGG